MLWSSKKICYETKQAQIIENVLRTSIPIKTLRNLVQSYAMIICIFSEPEKPIMVKCNYDNIIQMNPTTKLMSKNQTLFLIHLLTDTKEKLKYQNWSFDPIVSFVKDCNNPIKSVFIITEKLGKKILQKIIRFDVQTKTLQIICRSLNCYSFYFLTNNRILFYVHLYNKVVIYNWVLNTYDRYEVPYFITSFVSVSANRLTCYCGTKVYVLDLITCQWNQVYDHILIAQKNEPYYLPDKHVSGLDYWYNLELFNKENIFYLLWNFKNSTELFLSTSNKTTSIDVPIKDDYSIYSRSIILNDTMMCVIMMRTNSSKRIYIINFIKNQVLFQTDLFATDTIEYENDVLAIHDQISKHIFELPT